MIKVYDIIKHPRFMDIAAEVRAINGDEVTVKWLNQGYTKSWYLPVKEQILTLNSEWLIAVTVPACLRDAVWRQI